MATLCQKEIEALRSEVICPRSQGTELKHSLPTQFTFVHCFPSAPSLACLQNFEDIHRNSCQELNFPALKSFFLFASVVRSPFLEIPKISFQKPWAMSVAIKSAESKLMITC